MKCMCPSVLKKIRNQISHKIRNHCELYKVPTVHYSDHLGVKTVFEAAGPSSDAL